jgi:ArsR family transcriptional regulator
MKNNKDNHLLVFKALGEETKYKILELLTTREYCACEIPSIIKRTQSNTSMHLAKLQDWGLIQSRRDGKKILYTLKDKRVEEIFRLVKMK